MDKMEMDKTEIDKRETSSNMTKGNRTNGKLGTLLLTACAMPKNAAINESIYTVSQKKQDTTVLSHTTDTQ